MTYYEELRASELAFYHELTKEIKPLGFRCFLYNEDTSIWLYILTPNNSLLYLDNADFGGFNITYEYVPSRNFGSGCRCNENALYEVTADTLLKAEQYGRNYSSRGWTKVKNKYDGKYHRENVIRHPEHYTDAIKALKERWCYDKLTEL